MDLGNVIDTCSEPPFRQNYRGGDSRAAHTLDCLGRDVGGMEKKKPPPEGPAGPVVGWLETSRHDHHPVRPRCRMPNLTQTVRNFAAATGGAGPAAGIRPSFGRPLRSYR